MRRDHRPYWVKRCYLKFQEIYVNQILKPQLESLGKDFTFIIPWHIELFGSPIRLGKCANLIACSDKKIRLTIWSSVKDSGSITIGDYCLISPGVRISSALKVEIKNNCMLAGEVYITDSDWHGVYNRISSGKSKPVIINDNVWICDRATICKGVTIGENSIIGAGSVVTKDIPANTIAAGNPAKPIKDLDKSIELTKRDVWFKDTLSLFNEIKEIDRDMLKSNNLLGWFRSSIFPNKND